MLVDVANDLSYTWISPLVRTRDHDDGHVVLKKMVFDRLPLNDAPLPFTLYVYTACPASLEPTTVQRVSTKSRMSHIECMPLWKGDMLASSMIVKKRYSPTSKLRERHIVSRAGERLSI